MPAIREIRALLGVLDDHAVLAFGFDSPHSYRGYYDQPAVEPTANVTVASMKGCLARLVTETFTGYKGGEFTYHENQDLHLSYYGESREFEWARFFLAVAASLVDNDSSEDANLGDAIIRVATDLPRRPSA
jgi:hypothetical protein